MPKKVKHPRDMTSDEVMAHIFHPSVVKDLKKHVTELETKKPKRSKKEAK
jgi:hypothetical protein